MLSVEEQRTHKVLFPSVAPVLIRRGLKAEPSRHLQLPASAIVHIACPIIGHIDGGVRIIEDIEKGVGHLISPGEFLIKFTVVNAAERQTHQKAVVVHPSGSFYWSATNVS